MGWEGVGEGMREGKKYNEGWDKLLVIKVLEV